MKSDDMLLAGYPKTGTTWMRYFLYCLLLQRAEGISTSIDAMNAAMPEFANTNLFNKWQFEECARIVKTHQRCYPFFKGRRTVLIVRDPRDIVVSYFHHVSGLREARFTGTVSDVLRDKRMGVESFFKHFSSWQHNADLIVRYEDLIDRGSETFGKVADCFGVQRSSEEVQAAIDAASFSKMRSAQEGSEKMNRAFKEGHQFVRSGRKAEWRELFASSDEEYFDKLRTQYRFDLYG